MKDGYIPISRKLFEHPFWCERRVFSYAEAWIDLLRLVRFEANTTKMLVGSKMVEYGRGEYPASLRHLAGLWKWSKNKVDNFLDLLISEGMITKRTAEGTAQTIITVCNYDDYNIKSENKGQQTGQSKDGQGTAEGQTRDNTNKENKYNNIFSPPAYAYEGEFSPEVFEKSLPDCYNALVADQIWQESICMNNHITAEQFISKIQVFFKKLQNEGGKTKSVKDGQSHFARWLTIELQKKQKGDTNGRNKRSQTGDHTAKYGGD